MKDTIQNYVLGIDFGTTNSCVCYYENRNYHVIPDEMGNYITKSCIYFNPVSDEILYGDTAYRYKDGISNLKRLLGVTYTDFINDETLCYFFKHLHIVADKNNQFCEIVLTYNNELHKFGVQYIIELYVKYLLQNARQFLNINEQTTQKINAVITVPVEFTNIQRTLLKNIFENAGVNVMRIINEPTAAILPYVINDTQIQKNNEIENILVIDCGGGTTDFTVIECDYDDIFFEVKNTLGDNFLGGEDITNNLVDYVFKTISYQDYSIKLHNKIRNSCESCKCSLSYQQNTTMYIDDFSIGMSRSKFVNINKNFFDTITDRIENVTRGFEISRIVLVGGTTRIPRFTEICNRLFGKNIPIENTLNHDHVISIGAALQAHLLTDTDKEEDTVTLLDIIPMSLGVETEGGIMSPIISRCSIIPTSKTELFSNSDNDEFIDINVYQGERKFVKDNLFLGTFKIKVPCINQIRRNSVIICVTFDINSDGMLIVTSKNKTTNDKFIENETSIVINEYIKTDASKHDNYTYSDDYDKIEDSELAHKILAKIELNNVYQILKKQNDTGKIELLTDIEDVILNFKNYTIKQLQDYKTTLQSKFTTKFDMI